MLQLNGVVNVIDVDSDGLVVGELCTGNESFVVRFISADQTGDHTMQQLAGKTVQVTITVTG